ncbi:DUF1015 domain-containing protein [Blastococcus haudaquaticus]|uniref:Uncharacterized conserved protein, DUF1015 family n=1 Tax=Blastococcus haudaquaticus TaxID=1938745 RepID=A0A286GNX9_9ACTN|nr:DUF1015 domain-containing protein [Blastococcus haudaquaticus]SOD97212.1 Uncharacterized conserved protein, DUF1015 family [Blastococcus haudaquaticus]
MPESSSSRSSSSATGLDVRPFRALTYRQQDPGHLARVSSPAYDLVTPSGRERLAGTDPHNVVRLILPRVDGTTGGPPRSSAELAAATLRRWQDDGVLVRDAEPALWLYELRPAGSPPTAGWLGAVALPPAGSTAVLPHENTYPGAVEGRRELLAATGTDLEPIVLAHDPEPEVAALTDQVRNGPPTMTVDDGDGVAHRLWRVTDPRLLDRLATVLARTEAVIADGHHRFAAARANQRSSPATSGSDSVLALVTPMGPGGLRVDPIHRVVPDLDLDTAVRTAAGGFRVTELPTGGLPPADAVRRWIATPEATGMLLSDGERLVQLSEPTAEVRATVPSEAPAAWRRLDVVLAHLGLMAGAWQRPDDPDSVLIAHSVDEALQTASDRAGVAVLLRAPSPSDVAAVARAGARMPRKSTLFVPKPRTGLVLRPLAD